MLVAESGRLEQLAREFTEFGRLPEGPAAQVDLAELLAELARTQRARHHAGVARARPGPAHRSSATTIRSAARSATSSATRWRRARRRAGSTSRPAPDDGAVPDRDPRPRPRRAARAGRPDLRPLLDREERRHRARPRARQADHRDARRARSASRRRPAAAPPSSSGCAAGERAARRSSWSTTRPTSAGCWPRCSARRASPSRRRPTATRRCCSSTTWIPTSCCSTC